jgi:tetratricopeptide (TPR) repeat protein
VTMVLHHLRVIIATVLCLTWSHAGLAQVQERALDRTILHSQRLVQRHPRDARTYYLLGDAALEVGTYAQAQEAYQHMMQVHTDLYAYCRLSGLKSFRGDPQGAIADLEWAMQEGLRPRACPPGIWTRARVSGAGTHAPTQSRQGQAQDRPPENIAWVQWQLGNEHWALGNLVAAETQYQAALQTAPRYYRALAGLAQVRTYLHQALATNPHFHIFYADLAARILAELTPHPSAAGSQENQHDS